MALVNGLGKRRAAGAVLVTALVAGSALGLISRGSDLLPTQIKWIANLAAPWLLVGFLVGRRASSRSRAAIAGAVALAVAAVTHYLTARLLRHGLNANLLRHPVPMWVSIGALGGALFGAAGKASTEDSTFVRVAAAAALSSAFLGEAAFLLNNGVRAAYLFAVPLALICALVVPASVLPTSKQAVTAIVVGLLLAPAVVLTIGELQQISGRVYWIRTSSDAFETGDGQDFQNY